MDWVYFQVGESRHLYQMVRAQAPRLAMMATADDHGSLRWILAANDPYLKIVQVDRDAVNVRLVDELHAQHKLVSLELS